ncbi:MAG TPA: hypothetical protein VJ859_09465 [Allosphingosinicella sp.]|nr:hypothetical protein [Allosphingosinicella sp.]
MLRKITVIFAFAALGGCALLRPERPATLGGSWLVGGWVLKGESCDSDAGVIYGADGKWSSYGASGTWRLDRGRILVDVRSDEARRLDPPLHYVEQIERIGPDEYLARRGDGNVQRLVRCPAVRRD